MTTEERELFVRGAQTVSKKDTKMIAASSFRHLNGHKTEVMHDPVPLRATWSQTGACSIVTKEHMSD